jgi:nucleoside-diphosphate-sugar epimerase
VRALLARGDGPVCVIDNLLTARRKSGCRSAANRVAPRRYSRYRNDGCDVAALCLKAAVAPGVGGEMYNAGHGNRYSLNYVLLQEIEGIKLPAQYYRPRAGDVRDSQADTSAARRDLGRIRNAH